MKNKTKHIGITAVIACLLAIGMFSLIGCATTTSTAKDYMESGDYLFQGGEYDRAIRWYNRILEVYPNSPEAQTAQEKIAAAQRRKEQLAERDKVADEKRQQEAAQQQARAQEAAAAELRGNIRLFSAYKGTVLLNGEETKFTAEVTTRPGVYTDISVENAKDKEFTVAVRDSAGKVYQAKSKVLFEKTGNYTYMTVEIPDANGKYPYTPNPESDFTVVLTADGKGAVITSYSGRSEEVIIPATIQGMPVREIAGFFRSYSTMYIDWVSIPEGVTRIGSEAFSPAGRTGIYHFKAVDIPSTVTSIGDYAFSYSDITSITLPAGLKELGKGIFNSSSLTSFPSPWPKGITTIPEATFKNTRLTDVVIPEGITTLEYESFRDCRSLTNITLPSTIKNIRYPFDGTALTAINIPASVVKIDFKGARLGISTSQLSLQNQADLKRVGY